MVDKERAKKLLGSGVQAELVAVTLGCDPSYISQLMADESFRNEVVGLRVAALTANQSRDEVIDGVEDVLLEKIVASIDFITKPRELLSAFNIINKAQRRGVGAGNQAAIQNTVIVGLMLPNVVQQRFVTNNQGEVIEVDGKTLVTMPPAQLLRNLASQKENTDGAKAEDLRRLAARLPSSVLAKAGDS